MAAQGNAAVVLRWDSSTIWLPSHTGEWIERSDGPYVEVAQLTYGDVIFQRVEQEPVIWLQTESGPQELLVAGEGQWLTLEGAGENDVGDQVVFYQKHKSGGTPENTRSSLRSYNLETGEVVEILETGGWESGASFDYLSSEPTAVLHWWGEGSSGNAMVDLAKTSQLTWELAGRGCSDGEPDCVFYEHATVVGGRSVGVRRIENERSRVVDQVGIFEFDLEAGTERLIAAFPWNRGLWYVEDMFGFGPSSVMLSLSGRDNGAGNPLPAVVISIDSGEAYTLPDASFVRPAYLS